MIMELKKILATLTCRQGFHYNEAVLQGNDYTSARGEKNKTKHRRSPERLNASLQRRLNAWVGVVRRFQCVGRNTDARTSWFCPRASAKRLLDLVQWTKSRQVCNGLNLNEAVLRQCLHRKARTSGRNGSLEVVACAHEYNSADTSVRLAQ